MLHASKAFCAPLPDEHRSLNVACSWHHADQALLRSLITLMVFPTLSLSVINKHWMLTDVYMSSMQAARGNACRRSASSMRREPMWPLVISRQILSLLVVKVGTMSITGELLQASTCMHQGDVSGVHIECKAFPQLLWAG